MRHGLEAHATPSSRLRDAIASTPVRAGLALRAIQMNLLATSSRITNVTANVRGAGARSTTEPAGAERRGRASPRGFTSGDASESIEGAAWSARDRAWHDRHARVHPGRDAGFSESGQSARAE